MWRRPVVTILTLLIAVILTPPMRAQQKPFTRDQVQGLVRDGLGDESDAKLIEQRGIDFAPAEDSLQSLKAAGASEAFLNALRAVGVPQTNAAEIRRSSCQRTQISMTRTTLGCESLNLWKNRRPLPVI